MTSLWRSQGLPRESLRLSMTLDNWDHGEVNLGDGGRREAPEAGVGDEAQVLVFVAAFLCCKL